MSVNKILSIALAILWCAVGVSCSYDPCPCTKPAVRREWRTFSTEEKVEWIRAVNVSIDTLLRLVILLKRYSDSVLIKTAS